MRFSSLQREQLQSLQKRQEELRLSPEAKQRLEWLVYFVDHGRSISKTCHYFAIARTTLQRWLVRFDPSNPFSLEERSHRSLQIKKVSVSHHLVQVVTHYHRQYPYLEKKQLLQILAREQGIWMSVQELDRALVQGQSAPQSNDNVQPFMQVADRRSVLADSMLPITSVPELDVCAALKKVQTSVSPSEKQASHLFHAVTSVLHKLGIALSLVAIGWLLASSQLAIFAHDIRTQVNDTGRSVLSTQVNDTSSPSAQ
ncbi:MAG: hypothetical protein KBD00_00855 [Candidatus Peribacteraceae bacterium]|nr:hypothetical protein [Candidatus Peribacteraceae bacterium]